MCFILTNLVLFYIINKRFERNADMAQMVEHILGKDEVTGSIPVISSIKTLDNSRVFLFLKLNQIMLKFRYLVLIFIFQYDTIIKI